MTLKKGYQQLIAEAEAQIETVSAADAISAQDEEGVVIIDLRDVRERKREGYIASSVHVPRGMLEFWVDPDSPYYKDIFTTDRRLILHCSLGWRSALATKTLQDMGFTNAAHIDGGFKAWKEEGGAVEAYKR